MCFHAEILSRLDIAKSDCLIVASIYFCHWCTDPRGCIGWLAINHEFSSFIVFIKTSYSHKSKFSNFLGSMPALRPLKEHIYCMWFTH